MKLTKTLGGIALLCAIGTSAQAAEGWKFSVGVAGVDGIQDVVTYYKDTVGFNDGNAFDLPVGVTFSVYREFPNGLRLYLDNGPNTVATVSIKRSFTYDGSNSSTANYTFMDIPVGLSAGYVFMPSKDASPYVRAGIRYHAALGDFVKDSQPGVFGAIGMDFLMKRRVRIGFEAGFDTSTIRMKATDIYLETYEKTITPNRFMANVHVTF